MSSVSLAGRLEDLGLNDILQILSLSRKSGVLRMNYKEQGLELFVNSGQVVAARPHPSISTLHKFFSEKKLLDEGQQIVFLDVLKNKAFRPEPWTTFWAATFRMPQDKAKRWGEGYLIWLVTRAAGWNEGDFSFELDVTGSAIGKIRKVPVFPYLDDGLSAEFLAMEGARLMDEEHHSQSVIEPPDIGEQTITGAMPTPEEAEDSGEETGGHLLFVDPKPETSERVSNALREAGYSHVATADSVDAAVDLIERAEDQPWTVVSELVMPKRDRSGVLGGLEIAQELSDNPKVSEIYLCSDLINDEIESQGRDAGVTGYISKPARKAWKSNSANALKGFLSEIQNVIGAPKIADQPPEPEEDPGDATLEISLDDPLAALLDEEDLKLSVPKPKTDQGVHLLRHMIEELNNPGAESEVSLLILRFASDFFQRCVFLAITGESLTGLGQVGIANRDADMAIRDMNIPLNEGSVFDEVMNSHHSFVGKPPEHPLHQQFFNRLGGPKPLEILVAPILAGNQIIAMLYADQVPTQTKIEGVETLEIFLAQAGLALERAHLLRQIREMNSQRDNGQ